MPMIDPMRTFRVAQRARADSATGFSDLLLVTL
jgi:hypothetical protein